MPIDKTISNILSGTQDKNVRFIDTLKILKKYGFKERIKGNHHIFTKGGILEIINIQPTKGGKTKPYQVKQIRNLFLKYKIHKDEN